MLEANIMLTTGGCLPSSLNPCQIDTSRPSAGPRTERSPANASQYPRAPDRGWRWIEHGTFYDILPKKNNSFNGEHMGN